jgi:hypothetical protein
MRELEYQRCFCGQGISQDPAKAHAFDPCAVILIANWSKGERNKGSSSFSATLSAFANLRVLMRHCILKTWPLSDLVLQTLAL